MLGLASPLRDEIGGEVFTGDAAARLEAYGDLNRVTALAAADVRRVRFLYALCDDYFHTEHMNLAEGLLQRRIVQRIADVEKRRVGARSNAERRARPMDKRFQRA